MTNRNCIFYEEYQDMGAHIDLCNVKGTSWEDAQRCHCEACSNFFSLDRIRDAMRLCIKERNLSGEET